MFKLFFMLEWKAFFRSPAFRANLVMKIFMGLAAAYFGAIFLISGCLLYVGLEKAGLKPWETVNQYLIYYLLADLAIRYFMQKMPVLNVKPLMVSPVKRRTIVNFAIGKSVLSFFNSAHAFILIPFTVSLFLFGHPVLEVIFWHFSIVMLILSNNLLNLLINNKNSVFYPVLIVVAALIGAHYYGWFDVTLYTRPFFDLLMSPVGFVIAALLFVGLYYAAFGYFKDNLYFDAGLATKDDIAETENLNWLNRFGAMAVFLKNDIKLLKRNKRSRTTVIMSIAFLFYGLLFFSGAIEMYDSKMWQVFAGIFVSGGFLFTFGQFVPSWDSAYYQLMMSQNIKYKDYLASKWWLISIATAASTIIAAFYLIYGWEVYVLIIVGGIYNIGVNSHLVLLAGAYVKTPIDLSSSKRAFGDKQAFNIKTMLLSLPKLVLPIILYAIGFYAHSHWTGCAILAIVGLCGLAFRDRVFTMIERVYRTEKYQTIEAYKIKA